jgi:peroxiredoxin
MKLLIRIVLSVAAFLVASGATYVALTKWKTAQPAKQEQQDTLEGVSGLNEGEVVALPQLATLSGDAVDLASVKEERLLCVFISNRCPGCTRDAGLWRDLYKETANRAIAFYLVNVGDERAEIEKFVAAYELQQLPVLFDPAHKVGPYLRVGFVPQYVLFDHNGRVRHRWDGIQVDKQFLKTLAKESTKP